MSHSIFFAALILTRFFFQFLTFKDARLTYALSTSSSIFFVRRNQILSLYHQSYLFFTTLIFVDFYKMSLNFQSNIYYIKNLNYSMCDAVEDRSFYIMRVFFLSCDLILKFKAYNINADLIL